jgi:transcriptional regulator with XRE-family HTH domain
VIFVDNIGKRIKERRIQMGISAEELAPMVGLSAATIYRYEKGDIKKVNTTKLQPFAKALETTEAYLMGWEETADADTGTDQDEELWELREELRRNPEIRMLFSASKGAKKEHIQAAVAILNTLKGCDDSVE